jgi:hypothetical protein
MCEDFLNSWIKTKPDHAKLACSELDHMEPNQGLRHQIVIYKQKGEHSMTEVKWQSLLFWDFVHNLIF